MRNWLIVANAARARVFEDRGEGETLRTVADLVHTQSRQKGMDLAGDRPGHVEGQGHGTGGSAFVAHTDPREHERDRFALEVASLLNEGIAAGRCAALVLVASNPFLGHLKSHLSVQAARAVLRTVPNDFTTLHENEIVQRLHVEPAA